MKWRTQVGHVLLKDVRYSRWGIVAFVVFVGLSALRAFSSSQSAIATSTLPSAVAILLGISLAAIAIQADTPSGARAFWASRPLNPSAVFAAKLIFAMLVGLGIPAVGLFVALKRFHVDTPWMVGLLSGSILAYAGFIALGAIVAALTSDLRSFGLAYLIIFASEIIFSLFMPAASAGLGNGDAAGINGAMVFGFAADAAVLYYVYSRRDVRRRVWVSLGLLIAVTNAGQRWPAFTRPFAAGSFSAPHLVFARASDPHPSSSPRFFLHVEPVGVAADVQMSLAVDAMVIHLVNGGTVHPSGFKSGAIIHVAAMPTLHGTAEVNNTPMFQTPNLVSIQLTDDEAKRVRAGVSSVDVDGHLLAVRPRLVSEFTTVDSRVMDLRGARLRLHDAVVTPDSAALQIETDYIQGGLGGSYTYAGAPTRLDDPLVLMVNDSLHQVELMRRIGGSGGSGWLILPGINLGRDSFRQDVHPWPDDYGVVHITRDWLRGAHFALYDWDRLGSVPIHQHVDLRG